MWACVTAGINIIAESYCRIRSHSDEQHLGPPSVLAGDAALVAPGFAMRAERLA